MPEIGEHIPNKSRYKCMFEFIRPDRDVIVDGKPVKVTGAGRTNCIRIKGHSGKHMNIRGETPEGEVLKPADILKKDYQ
jgi:hypothetical protein